MEFPTGMHMDTWLAGGDHYWRTVQLFLEQNVPQNSDDASSNQGNGKFLTLNIFCKSYYSTTAAPTLPSELKRRETIKHAFC